MLNFDMGKVLAHKTQNRKFLVPVDGSPSSLKAMKHAVLLAKSLGGSVFAYHVLHLPLASGIVLTKSMKDASNKKIDSMFDATKKVAWDAGVPYKQQVQGSGNSGKRIVDWANKFNFDMIVLGSRGMGSAREAFLGSTSNYVAHKSKVPVLLIK